MLDDAQLSSVSLEIRLGGTWHDLRWPGDQSLLDALAEAGLSAPSSCRAGKCGACVCTVTEGRVDMAHNEILDEEDLAEGYVLGCQARPLTDSVRISFD